MKYRIEKDSLGEVRVDNEKYWAAQTQRSLENFKIGNEKMPMEQIYSIVTLKKACAIVNNLNLDLSDEKLKYISLAADEILSSKFDDNFPLKVYQTGSGTQTNMNVNEVITNRANELAKEVLIKANDDVNMSQSSNDVFPTAMHMSIYKSTVENLIPALEKIIDTFKNLEKESKDIVKIARTHLQDATPIRFSQELSGYRSALEYCREKIIISSKDLLELPIGATAVGTGINAKDNFSEEVCKILSKELGYDFKPARNKFHSISQKDYLVNSHSSLKTLAADLLKIVNDIRLLTSGPRCGLSEITIPSNEPGSSIMPGKVNPTQAEALSMVCVDVMANDYSISMASSLGNFELNTFMPLIINNYLKSIRVLSDGINSFNEKCLVGLKANKKVMDENLHKSPMLVTILNPIIGYEKAAKISQLSIKEDISLKEAALKLGYLSEEEFDKYLDIDKML
ncbi:class II fumarate hydratase [Peptoniphilus obesi]|uniref:class II fumarate hydratase n=1 Tax=Peptoniphilus obesi TaxID=1472765 RepID=UPI0004B07E59|nr:class II fumarate hydratase [Peptoniphilus obesi]